MSLKGVLSIIAGVLLLASSPLWGEQNPSVGYYLSGTKNLLQLEPDYLLIDKAPNFIKNIGAAKRRFIGIMTKLGYYCPQLISTDRADRPPENHKEASSLQELRVAVAHTLANLKPQAQEQCLVVQGGSSGYSFPVAGPFSFRDTWGEPRPGGRSHRAVDIFAREGTAVFAVTTGVIKTLATFPEAGLTLLMEGQDGRGYGYMHLQGYAPGLAEGKVVRTGELIGYVGHTGVQESEPHLHLQVYADQRLCKDELINPYPFLVQLCHGIGVTDFYQQRIARRKYRDIDANKIKFYQYPWPLAFGKGDYQKNPADSMILVSKKLGKYQIKNFPSQNY